MSPWTIIGWCVAALTVLVTIAVFGTVVSAVVVRVMAFRYKPKPLARKEKEKVTCAGCDQERRTESLCFCIECRDSLGEFRSAQLRKHKSKWSVG